VQKSGSFVTSTLFTNNPYPDQQKQRAGSTESVLPVFYSQNVNLKEEGADRMEWCDILSVHRERQITSSTVPHDLRSEFEKDYHRIIGSASFRRLQDKTQVFPLDRSDFIRTRLTHSLEVSSFARSLGESVGARILSSSLDASFGEQQKEDISNILQCAGLIHDIGNPPFGHYGEICIRQWFREHLPEMMFNGRKVTDMMTEQMIRDFYSFEGNAQALRLLSRLHFLIDGHGMNLTYALLSTIVKYPVSSLEADPESDDICRRKVGYFYADRVLYQDIMNVTCLHGHRSPLAFLLEAADDIAYKTADIEDACKKGFLSYHDLLSEFTKHRGTDPDDIGLSAEILLHQLEKGKSSGTDAPEMYAVQNWAVRIQSYLLKRASDSFLDHYQELMAGSYTHDLFYGTKSERLMELLGDIGFRYVFDTKFIYKMEIATGEVFDYLLTKYIHAALYYDTEFWKEMQSPVDFKLMSVISDNYKQAYRRQAAECSEGERLYLRLLLVTDTICGMTDSYAKSFYQDIRGIH